MTIVATAIPKITDEFQKLDAIGWYGSAFFLTVASFQSTWGKAYKYFPLKTTFLLAVFVFELGSLICGKAPPTSVSNKFARLTVTQEWLPTAQHLSSGVRSPEWVVPGSLRDLTH
jgi:MFS family permease